MVLMHKDGWFDGATSVKELLMEFNDSLQKLTSPENLEKDGKDPRANSFTDELLFEPKLNPFALPGAYEKLSSVNDGYY